MCGRYAIFTDPKTLREMFGYDGMPNFPARYNVAPTQPVPIVRFVEGRREFALVRWGLIPAWVKDPRAFSLIINARGESVLDKPAFRNAMKRRRCLFPADGFYEWKRDGERKQPYFTRLVSRQPMAFAGLWEAWMGPNGEEMETGAIITTGASRSIAHIHDRMPAIISPDAFNFWLDPKVDGETALALVAPAREGTVEAYEVSAAVNRTANDGPQLVMPLSEQPAEAQAATPAAPKPAPAKRTKKPNDETQGSLF
jgi:putative SOS response-associated peptidase YedK